MVVSVHIWAVYNVLPIALIQETADIQFLLRGRFVCDVISLRTAFCYFQLANILEGYLLQVAGSVRREIFNNQIALQSTRKTARASIFRHSL